MQEANKLGATGKTEKGPVVLSALSSQLKRKLCSGDAKEMQIGAYARARNQFK